MLTPHRCCCVVASAGVAIRGSSPSRGELDGSATAGAAAMEGCCCSRCFRIAGAHADSPPLELLRRGYCCCKAATAASSPSSPWGLQDFRRGFCCSFVMVTASGNCRCCGSDTVVNECRNGEAELGKGEVFIAEVEVRIYQVDGSG